MKLSKGIILIILTSLLVIGCNRNDKDNIQKDHGDNIEGNENNLVVEEMEEEKIKGNKIEKDKIEEEKTKEDEKDKIKEQIKSMSLEEKVGQLIIAGFQGVELSDYTIDLINKYNVGGFILFSRNIDNAEQTLKLLNDLKLENSSKEIPLFLSIDEEGGNVSRLPNTYTKIPEAMEFGNKDNKEISYELGQILGRRVKSLGFNVDFAPVLDIYSNPKNKVIRNRAYGTTVEKVVNNGIEVMKGIRSTGVIPGVKHFPGHGDTSLDSHIELPKVGKTLEELEVLELIPFKKAIKEQVEIIMIAHILYPKIDLNHPASMSKNIIQKYLRETMGYKGVVASDDMTMGAIIENYNLEDAVLEFIKSGGDLALICHEEENPILAVNKIIDAVNKGDISEKEIDEKVYRIIKLKENYNLEDKAFDIINLDELNKDTKLLVEKLSN
ncbi:MAG TPA: beta-N-acetylhexosaminidase [Tissierellaceae bacterium]|nr:beta-N-acetylhexosaminidase [Tissierellaceae bacterium]